MTYKTLLPLFIMILTAACSGGPNEYADSCSVSAVEGGALISCPDGSQQVVLDGTNGVDGVNGTNGQDGQDAALPDSSVVEMINPCGPSGGFDEVLLVLADGSIVAYFSGVGGFLTMLNCNQTYRTTDSQACTFRINAACKYEEV